MNSTHHGHQDASTDVHLTDKRILTSIADHVARTGEIDPALLKIQVLSGVVTLEGRIESELARIEIQKVIAALAGVRNVRNHLTIGSP